MQEELRSELDESPYTRAESESEPASDRDRLNDTFREAGRRMDKIKREKALIDARAFLAEIDFLEAKIALTQSRTAVPDAVNYLQKQIDGLVSSVEWALVSRKGDDRKKMFFYTPADTRRLLRDSGYKELYENQKTMEKAMALADAEKRNADMFGRDSEVRRMTLQDFDSTYVESKPTSRFAGRT